MANFLMSLRTAFPSLLGLVLLPSWVSFAASGIVDTKCGGIQIDQLGAEVQKQYVGEGISITPTATGARLRAVMQDLEGEATSEGLWLKSTADEDAGKANRFRVRAVEVGKKQSAVNGQRSTVLAESGTVRATKTSVAYVRPGLIEEYTVSTDGVRQDFVVLQRPAGQDGELNVILEVLGARAGIASYGVKLTVTATGRELAYSRLKVTDATGKELKASMQVDAIDRLRVEVEDAGAVYPVRIDPTFSDANWISISGLPGTNGLVRAIAVDGNGNLYMGGTFTIAGNVFANRIAKWNGSEWSPLLTGMNGTVMALAVMGDDLYAGGSFSTADGAPASRIAKWNGSAWSAVGSGWGANVTALAVIGSDLYAGGDNFTFGDVVMVGAVAKWDGSAWLPLGTGMDNPVSALAVSGSDLYAAGGFTMADGAPASRVAKWNGSTWSALGSGTDGWVRSLAASGSDLYAGGDFFTAGGNTANRIAKWDGNSWSALGSGINNTVKALAVSGSDLYAGGFFTNAGGVSASNIAKWNGSAWSALGEGRMHSVDALSVLGGDLYAGGAFTTSGAFIGNHIAKWNGSEWTALGAGTDSRVNAIAVSGSDLYVGGKFLCVGGVSAKYIAKWDGSAWSALGSGMNFWVNALAVSGGDLYAGGDFTTAGGTSANRIAKWDGSAWTALGQGIGGSVNALAVSGGNLYAGGGFITAGGTSANKIARWDGSVWSPLGSGLDDEVHALALIGSDLYAGGDFVTAGGASANRIAKWNGGAWSALGTGMDDTVYALAASGSNLYAGGDFNTAGGGAGNGIARWDGSEWSALGTGTGKVYALAVSGSDLYAAGGFVMWGDGLFSRIARWDGSEWSALVSGTNDDVITLAIDGSSLYAGGDFETVGGIVSPFLAKADLSAIFPLVALESVSDTTATSVTLHGSVNPNGLATTVVFEYGPTSGYGSSASVTLSPSDGESSQSVSVGLTGLAFGTVYHYRLAATSAAGTVYSSDATFVTVNPPGALAFGATAFTIEEDEGSITIPIIRTGGTGGAVTVNVTTTKGSATAPGDFTALSNEVVTIPHGVSSGSVDVTIVDSGTAENNETFAVTLSAPTGGASLGSPVSAPVTIIDLSADGVAPPAPTITVPAVNSSVGVPSLGSTEVKGAATDLKGVKRVLVSLDGVNFTDAVLTIPGAPKTGYVGSVSPVTGVNTVRVKTVDYGNNESPVVTRIFKVIRPLVVNVDANLGSVTTGFTPGPSFRESGRSYTIAATPKTAGIFMGWSFTGATLAQLGLSPSALQKQTLTFIFRENLVLTANFAPNPYGPAVIGTYNGLVRASPDEPARPVGNDGSVPGLGTEGYLTVTVLGTGAFSGRLTMDGFVLNVAGAFDGQGKARFGTARAETLTVPRAGKPSLVLKLDIGGPSGSAVPAGQIVGTVTALGFLKATPASVSDVTARRAHFTGLAGLVVPDEYLTVTGTAPSPAGRTDGVFTVALPSVPLASQPQRIDVLKDEDYPKGDGVGSIKMTKAGLVTLTATLADGTPITASSTLSQDLDVALFVQLYGVKGFLSAPVTFDHTQADSDLKKSTGGAVLWCRPFNSASHYYAYGWAETLELDLLGAKYVAVSGQGVFKAPDGADGGNAGDPLQSPDADGNVTLTFSEGQILETSLIKSANLNVTTDVAANVPDNDPTFTMKVNRTTGAITGIFDHTDDTKPAYNAVILQKGPNAGARGFFLTKQPTPIDYTGESGKVRVTGSP
jgi:hypothetical protein